MNERPILGEGSGELISVEAVFRLTEEECTDGPLLYLMEFENELLWLFSRIMAGSIDDRVCKSCPLYVSSV